MEQTLSIISRVIHILDVRISWRKLFSLLARNNYPTVIPKVTHSPCFFHPNLKTTDEDNQQFNRYSNNLLLLHHRLSGVNLSCESGRIHFIV